ncbi:fibrillin-2 isoform X2 [Contarinia nasturtii]|uniref:fibrillin-2 isoform X2 n=1 Tax=Contarinia nasturtii TaxID=265458 RepID=UPI0012D3A7C7|nr:fibrillin-2 isoform X2 [Contarinia nasturtii]
MNRNTFLVWIFVCYWSCTVYTVNGVYTDCERPPPVLHGKSDLSVDYDGTIVTALYKCDAGYRLHGESQLTCDTDTDEWLGDLPACQLETGSNSTVSEIEQGMIGVIGTVAPGLTHEEFIEPVEQPTTKGPNTNEIEAPPSQAPALDSEQHVEHVETSEHESAPQTEAPTNALKKRKGHRKGKKPEFQEDNTIDADFASRLDMSCIDGVTAPSVSDAHIVEYIRAKKDEYKFLVAIYGCDEDYYLENPQSNRLYCSQGIWVGNYPVCVMKEGDVDYGTDSDDDNQNENSDSIKTDTENTATNSVQQNNENINTETVEKNVTPNEPISVASTNDNSNVDEQIITNEIIPQTKEETINVIPNEIEKPTPTSNSCDVNNGGCEQICNMVPDDDIGANVPECSCNIGFYLDQMDGVKCLDINECEYPSICPNECENTMGSYRCLDDVEIIPTTVNVLSSTEFNAPVKACGDGLRLDESNNCIDIDECAEGNTGCEYCQNSVGGYQCTCPDGFVLKDDEKTCRDIDECTTFADYEYEENTPTARTICSHQCINTVGSYLCVCPNNFHLGDDKRTCEQDFCRHLNDIAANKTKCSHDCVDDVHGYQCKCPDGATLDADMKTCIFLDACSISGDRCLPGKCVNIDSESFKCECPSGFAEHNQRCVDYDECAIGTHQCSHKCMNTDGSYLCECPDGLILSNDQHTCVAADICAADNGGCSDICNFVNEKVICSCLDDAELDTDGKTCRKKNICAENNGGCQQVCDDKMNRCECFPGFETFDDAKTCHDANECLQNNGGCPQQCVNTEGEFECTCFDGFEKDEGTGNCIDKNECDVNNGNCDHECINTQGSYQCTCRSGYSLSADQHQCVDINECEIDNGKCSDTCVNLQGSYLCSCPEGMFLVNDDHACEYLNECEVNNGGCSHKCNSNKGVLTCSCPVGFEIDEAGKVCIDQNECLTNNGGCEHQCVNHNGTHECICNANYQLASNKYACLDVDECIENNGNCSNICINLLGSYQCACEAGFELRADKHTCHDIDECTASIHDCEQICKNVAGGYECGCHTGYKLARNHLSCIDIDECALPNACGADSKCINTDGSFHCNPHCPIGYELSETNECIDKNECDENAPKSCSHQCTNTPGSFVCSCPNGMKLASDLSTCIDINECAINNGGCDQKCVNIEGDMYCECDLDGFTLADDKKTCISSDPCGLKNGGCAHVCEPLNGKAQCFCYKGFELNASDNRSCSDINECLLNHGCEGKCTNTIGSYKCDKKDCPKGFRLNAAGNCADVNECEVYENGGCSPNSECINFLGGFRCICKTGYKLDNDKVTCVEVKDSCLALAAPEHGNVRCSRSRHSSQSFHRTKCSFWCKDGFTLMGPSVKYCNSTDGQWDTTEISCVQSACPPLQVIQPGTMSDDCLNGRMYPGQSCALICPQGFKSAAPGITQCLPNRQWTKTDLRCEPIQHHVQTQHYASQGNQQPNHNQNYGQNHGQKSAQNSGQNHLENHGQNGQNGKPKIKTVIKGGETHHVGHIKLGETTQSSSSTQNIVRPYIKCPQDTVISLPKNQKFIHIKLEQPKSNVNWAYIEANPKWAKNLQAHLAAGQHIITFTAHSPNSASITETCRTILTVKPVNGVTFVPAVPASILGPKVSFCPPTQDVQLQPHELKRPIYWREPAFQAGTVRLKQIFKSHLPGTTFGVGQHRITYIATDVQNQNGTCQFTIVVRPAARAQLNAPYVNGPQINNLNDHDTYLLCKGQPDMKLDTSFPRAIPPGCIIKNVRKNRPLQYNPHRRRHAFSANNNFLRYYSSWNQPEYNHYF